jgi:hypothetical protein
MESCGKRKEIKKEEKQTGSTIAGFKALVAPFTRYKEVSSPA